MDDYRDLAPSSDIKRLLEIMARLRDEDTGCDWDKAQTFQTIAPYTIEEAYEVKDAIDRNDMVDLCDELGDLLLQVVYHAEIAKEAGHFDFGDVVNAITKKMLRRHPHVFGTEEQKQKGLQPGEWERIKTAERSEKAAAKGVSEQQTPKLLDAVPNNLPALSRALKLQKKAATVGFDWDDINQVFEKLREEFQEIEEARRDDKDKDAIEEELGDILFVAVNLARHMKIDPEKALSSTNQKFIHRFHFIEDSLKANGQSLQAASLDEMEALWQKAKSH